MKGTGKHWRVIVGDELDRPAHHPNARRLFVVQRRMWNGWRAILTPYSAHGDAMKVADHLARRGHRV